MKSHCAILNFLIFLLAEPCIFGQGFINLNFEQANVSGYAVNSSSVPVTSAFPGWQAYYGGTMKSEVWYDATSLGGNIISIWDANTQGTYAISGKFSAALFASLNVSSSISQTGTVPVGTESLTVDIAANSDAFSVSLGGDTLSLTALFEGGTVNNPYTLYGADISSFAGLTSQQLTITCLAGGDPNGMIVDNIQFSSSPVPEPGVMALAAFAAASVGVGLRRKLAQP